MAKISDLPLTFLQQRLNEQIDQNGALHEVDSNGVRFSQYAEEIERREKENPTSQPPDIPTPTWVNPYR